jgi:methionyl-tRNA formyltransferase
MKVIFMGTPEFALPGVKAIAQSTHEICLIVTGQDKPAGRGQQLREPPVKQLAKELDLPIIQPPSLKAPDFAEQLRQTKADIIVVIAFRILPDAVLAATRFGAINLHASLLPKYRGAAPINWALINGDRQTGVTIFQIRSKIDTGEIIRQIEVDIAEDDTFGTLSDRLAQIGGTALVDVLNDLESGTVVQVAQNDVLATKAPKIFPQLGEIDWAENAETIRNLIHGLSPTPGAYSFFGKKRIKFLKARFSADSAQGQPGTIGFRDKQRIGIQTGSGILYPLVLQAAGRQALPVTEFLRGFQARIGDRFHS